MLDEKRESFLEEQPNALFPPYRTLPGETSRRVLDALCYRATSQTPLDWNILGSWLDNDLELCKGVDVFSEEFVLSDVLSRLGLKPASDGLQPGWPSQLGRHRGIRAPTACRCAGFPRCPTSAASLRGSRLSSIGSRCFCRASCLGDGVGDPEARIGERAR